MSLDPGIDYAVINDGIELETIQVSHWIENSGMNSDVCAIIKFSKMTNQKLKRIVK